MLPGGAKLILVHAAGEDHAAGAEAVEEWELQDGLERTLFTSTATIATAIGFALLLLAGMLVAGDRIEERRAISWAAAGFVYRLAPGLGLSPELPGMAAAELAGRPSGVVVCSRRGDGRRPVAGSALRQQLAAPRRGGDHHRPACLGRSASRRVPGYDFRPSSQLASPPLRWGCRRRCGSLPASSSASGGGVSAAAMSASQPNEPTATGTLAVTVFVCTSCRRAAPTGAIERPGGDLVGELSRRFRAAGAEDVMVTGVECLAVCKRPCTVAVTADACWTYLVGDLDPAQHTDDIVRAVLAYRSGNGIVPWSERPILCAASPACRRLASAARSEPVPDPPKMTNYKPCSIITGFLGAGKTTLVPTSCRTRAAAGWLSSSTSSVTSA